MGTSKVLLNIESLSKSYGKKRVLAPTDLKVYDGECLVLLGGNGAGKSTLIKLITGVEKPSSGSFKFTVAGKKNLGLCLTKCISHQN